MFGSRRPIVGATKALRLVIFESLLYKDLPRKGLETRIATQRAQKRNDFKEDDVVSIPLLIGLLEETDRFFLMAKPSVNDREIIGRNITLAGSLAQPLNHCQRLDCTDHL